MTASFGDGHGHGHGPNSAALGRTQRLAAVGTGVLFAGAVAYTGLADPHRPGFLFPGCPFKVMTGWNCPACGGLRMTHDLLHGDVAAAVMDNVFVLVGLPMLLTWLMIRWRMGRRLMPVPAIVALVGAAIVWTVVRNVPGFPLVPTFHGG